MDGNLQVAYDISTNFISAWNEMFVDNDFINAFTGKIDPRHMYGTSNFDVFRWNSLNNGTQRSVLGTFIATLLMPGIPLVRPFILTDSNIPDPPLLVVLWRRTELLLVRQYGEQLPFWVRACGCPSRA